MRLAHFILRDMESSPGGMGGVCLYPFAGCGEHDRAGIARSCETSSGGSDERFVNPTDEASADGQISRENPEIDWSRGDRGTDARDPLGTKWIRYQSTGMPSASLRRVPLEPRSSQLLTGKQPKQIERTPAKQPFLATEQAIGSDDSRPASGAPGALIRTDEVCTE
jgi:hypothetical protein